MLPALLRVGAMAVAIALVPGIAPVAPVDAATPARAGDPPLPARDRVSVGIGDTAANGDSEGDSVSADGRYVAFESAASNLVPGDTNRHSDVFVRDRRRGVTLRVSLDASGRQAALGGTDPAISADGRHVAFVSSSSDLVAGDTNGDADVFVKDLDTGSVERVSMHGDGSQAGGDCSSYNEDGGATCPFVVSGISDDGQVVAFETVDADIVRGDDNTAFGDGWDVFVRDRTAGTTVLASRTSEGAQLRGTASSGGLAGDLSGDGRHLAFVTNADGVAPGDNDGRADVFVRDLMTGRVVRASERPDSHGLDADSGEPSLSRDGSRVAFTTRASDLAADDRNDAPDVVVVDLATRAVELASVDTEERQVRPPRRAESDQLLPDLSADGRRVVFSSEASELSPSLPFFGQVYLRDLDEGDTWTVSTSAAGESLVGRSGAAAISADGATVAFRSSSAPVGPVAPRGSTRPSPSPFRMVPSPRSRRARSASPGTLASAARSTSRSTVGRCRPGSARSG